MKTTKKDNKLFVNYKFLLLSSFFLISCQVVPTFIMENIVAPGFWASIERTELGDIVYKQRFYANGLYQISKNNELKYYYYTIGYTSPKFAFILHDINPKAEDEEDLYYIVETPIYFYFDFENNSMVTSSNANMAYPRKWTGYL